MRIPCIAVAISCALFAMPASAQLIGSGHVLGNGTSSPAAPTDVPLSAVFNQAGSGIVRSGSGGVLTYSGTLTNGHCPTFNSGNIIDSGAPCATGTGSGTVAAGQTNQLSSYASNGTTVTGTFTPSFPETANWYADLGANIQRWNNRTFIGGATALDGKQTPTSKDWLFNQGEGWLSNFTVLLVETLDSTGANGSLHAITGAAQTLYATSLPIASSIGTVGICYNNNTTLAAQCWGSYDEGHRMNSTVGATFGRESDIRNLGNEFPIDPYTPPDPTTGITAANWLGCGAGIASPTPNPCSAAVGILANSATFDAGITFLNGSLKQVSGRYQALQMPELYSLTWYSGAGTVGGALYVNASGQLEADLANSAIVLTGNVGVSCTGGINTSTFRAVGGIVTHC